MKLIAFAVEGLTRILIAPSPRFSSFVDASAEVEVPPRLRFCSLSPDIRQLVLRRDRSVGETDEAEVPESKVVGYLFSLRPRLR